MTLKSFRLFVLSLVLGLFSNGNADVGKDTHLEALVSSNESTRKNALMYLDREFASLGRTEPEPRYQSYGNDLLQYLYQSIVKYDDRYAHYAAKALFQMSWIHRIGSQTNSQSEEMAALLKDFEDIPNPADYGPLRDALILMVRESTYDSSRFWSAKVLGMSFGPSPEIEELLFGQLVKDRNKNARRGIMEGITHLVTRVGYSGSEYLSALGVRAKYSYFYKGASVADGGWNGVLLPDQSVMFERGTGVTLDFTIEPVSEEEYDLSYRLYDLYEEAGQTSNLKEKIVGQVKGNFGATLNLDIETMDLKIESTVFVERVPRCLKKQLASCFR